MTKEELQTRVNELEDQLKQSSESNQETINHVIEIENENDELREKLNTAVNLYHAELDSAIQVKRVLWALIDAVQSMDTLDNLRVLVDSLDRDWAMNNFNNSEHYFLKKQEENEEAEADQQEEADTEEPKPAEAPAE